MLRDSAVKKSRRAAEFVNRYAFAVLCPAAGCFAGVWGALAGLAAGTFITLVRIRRLDEKGWKRAVEQGNPSGAPGEPFPGALYVCALAVYSLEDTGEPAGLAKKTFGSEYRADWWSLCRAAASASQLNSDLLVECLAHVIRKNTGLYSPDMMRNVFTMLKTAECSWNEERESEKPSRYLAGLLDYHYVSGELSSAYHTLGLVPGATPEQVRAAHRKLAAKFHPDSSAADSGSFMRVQSAYELILRQL